MNTKVTAVTSLSSSRYSNKDRRTIDKYLALYAEPESQRVVSLLAPLPDRCWEYVVTIPACGEDRFLPGALASINICKAVQENKAVLCIIVLNGNVAREQEFGHSNELMRRWFAEQANGLASLPGTDDKCPQSLRRWNNIDILVIDRSQVPWLIPADQGVGLVRKIGADCALALIAAGKIRNHWIHATDADARLPPDYFINPGETVSRSGMDKGSVNTVSCVIYPYQHIPDSDMDEKSHQRYWSALTEYELWLRYYVAGLRWAGSKYAFPSIGSLLAFDALAYAKIRGFPKRMAGEDFYFQNKLAKIGRMLLLQGDPVRLLTRASTRVPFGTGQGTISIDVLNNSGGTYSVYHPRVFSFLKGFNCAVQRWFNHAEIEESQRRMAFIACIEEYFDAPLLSAIEQEKWLHDLLAELDIFKHLYAAEKRSRSAAGAINQFTDWFDGFKTLKLIHRLRDELYGSLPLLQALQQSVFLQAPAIDIDGEELKLAWLDYFRTESI